jgi:hypothetical protein
MSCFPHSYLLPPPRNVNEKPLPLASRAWPDDSVWAFSRCGRVICFRSDAWGDLSVVSGHFRLLPCRLSDGVVYLLSESKSLDCDKVSVGWRFFSTSICDEPDRLWPGLCFTSCRLFGSSKRQGCPCRLDELSLVKSVSLSWRKQAISFLQRRCFTEMIVGKTASRGAKW